MDHETENDNLDGFWIQFSFFFAYQSAVLILSCYPHPNEDPFTTLL